MDTPTASLFTFLDALDAHAADHVAVHADEIASGAESVDSLTCEIFAESAHNDALAIARKIRKLEALPAVESREIAAILRSLVLRIDGRV